MLVATDDRVDEDICQKLLKLGMADLYTEL